jgi:choline monooxygenase
MKPLEIEADITRAKTLETRYYKENQFFEADRERIFSPSWQYVGHTALVPDAGSFHPVPLLSGYLNEPLLLTRDKSDTLHCLSNVCTHRGNLLAWEPGKSSQLRCRYHGRVFQLDGTFTFMPEFKSVEDFPSPCDHLHRLPLFKWGPMLFAQVAPGEGPEAFFDDMMKRVGWLPIDRMQLAPEMAQVFEVKAHWALYCENYLEGFHIPFVHGGLSAVLDYASYTTEIFAKSNLQLGIAKEGELYFELPPDSPDFGKKVAAYYFWVFPNMMFNFYPWGLSFNLIEPLAIDRTRVTFLPFVYDSSKLEQGAGSGLGQVEIEDEEVVEAVQLGIRSRFYQYGRYAPEREQGTHHFHRLIAGAYSGYSQKSGHVS